MSIPRIGILGGGQLAQMLCQAAKSLAVHVSVFSEDQNCPAATATDQIIVGQMNEHDLAKFIANLDIVLFESEFVDVTCLRNVQKLIRDSGEHNFNFYPSLETMSCLQDKILQKQLCINAKCPTTKWELFNLDDNLDSQIDNGKQIFVNGAVLKWSRNGYDGKGNLFVTNWDAQRTEIKNFITQGVQKSAQTYAEEMIQFKTELAVVCVCDQSKNIHPYPVVVSEQKNGACLNVFGPSSDYEVSEDLQCEVVSIATKIANYSNVIGTFAVELFLTKDDKLLVNEIAPRVHNTGHYTQDCTVSSQFENHLLAVLGKPISNMQPSKPYYGMRNILGPEGVTLDRCAVPQVDEPSKLHWYYKSGTRPGRKLGHINICANDRSEFDLLWKKALQEEETWIKLLKNN